MLLSKLTARTKKCSKVSYAKPQVLCCTQVAHMTMFGGLSGIVSQKSVRDKKKTIAEQHLEQHLEK